jgi:hypothetical protein
MARRSAATSARALSTSRAGGNEARAPGNGARAWIYLTASDQDRRALQIAIDAGREHRRWRPYLMRRKCWRESILRSDRESRRADDDTERIEVMFEDAAVQAPHRARC